MNAAGHLTKEQLDAYAADSLAQSDRGDVGSHLLQCAICRDALPIPTTEQFWSALLADETEVEESFEIKNLYPARAPFSTVFAFFRQPLAWGASALIIIASVSFLIWLGASKQSNSETEVAQTIETPRTENIFPKSEKLPDRTEDEDLRANVQESPPPPGIINSYPNDLGNNQSSNATSGVVSDPIGANLGRESKIEARRPAPTNTVLASKTRPSEGISVSERLFAKNENVLIYPAALNRVIRSELLTLKGSTAETDFDLITPVRTFIKDDSPTLVWQKVPEAVRYEVAVRSAKGVKTIVNESTSATSYKVPGAVFDEYQGQVLQWSVTAYAPDGTSRTAPSGSEPEALFLILDREKVADVEKRIFRARENPLTVTVILANAGLLDDAENEIKKYLTSYPHSKKARTLLKQIRSWRTVKGRTNPPNR